MNYTVARLAFVALAAAIFGVFVALAVYFTLVAALIFLLLATGTAVAIKINARKRARSSLESAKVIPVQRLTRPGGSGRTRPDPDKDRR